MLVQCIALLLLVAAALPSVAYSFRYSGLKRLNSVRAPGCNAAVWSTKSDDAVPQVGGERWQIDDDSSEVICESSSEVARKAELAKLEAKRAAEEKARKEAEAAAAAEKARKETEALAAAEAARKAEEAAVKAVVTTDAAPSKSNVALTEGSTSAFDVGLFIAFPVILATLGLFFVFPLIKDQLAANLPPPMTQ